MSVVRLESVAGLTLQVRGADMLDGTPVLDLKPYVAYTDAYPSAGNGWLEGEARVAAGAQPADPVRAYGVCFAALAVEQAAWIEAHTGLAIAERIRTALALGPMPHAYRRIRRMEGWLQLSVKEWRVRFTVAGREVSVTRTNRCGRIGSFSPPGRVSRFCDASGPRAPESFGQREVAFESSRNVV
jgi:hypothetical protein